MAIKQFGNCRKSLSTLQFIIPAFDTSEPATNRVKTSIKMTTCGTIVGSAVCGAQLKASKQTPTASTSQPFAKLFLGQQVGGRAAAQTLIISRNNNAASRGLALQVSAVKDGAKLDRPLRVAVIGGGPSGGANCGGTRAH